MSLPISPLLYLNMGGEMLYVLTQRLKAQKIPIDKSIQVLNEVSRALIDPLTVTSIFQQKFDMNFIRGSLERAVLSSIMRLDETSMGKLFDLMIMMVKYQLSVATTSPELLLMSLNHIDAMRDALVSPKDESLEMVHHMLIQLYGNMTHEELWKVRNACLIQLQNYNVRVSILLRLGLQSENGTFPVVTPFHSGANSSGLTLMESWSSRGSLDLFGDRAASLGRSLYLSECAQVQMPMQGRKDSGNELGMLAIQLGSTADACVESSTTNLFTLRLLNDDIEPGASSNEHEIPATVPTPPPNETKIATAQEDQHRAKLKDICGNLFLEENSFSARQVELLDLMDQLE